MLSFGEVSIDLDAREVVRAGQPRHLEPRAFDLLRYLIEARDRVVPKEELLDAVWGDQFVSESALTTRIKEIRQALGDDGKRQAVIKNVRGRGYRFVGALGGTRPGGEPAGRMIGRVALIGREDEVGMVAGLLDEARVVTLIGPGGVGKTALSLAVAEAVAPRFADGVIVVDLSTLSDPAAVVAAASRSASLADSTADAREVLAALARLEALMVLDNCDHLVEAAADLLDQLVADDSPIRVLATSRERIGVLAEHLFPVETLAPEAARQLFAQRAGRARPGFEVSAHDEPLVDELLDLVDRLPLAIEMAAARLPAIGLADLVELVRDRVDVLRSPIRATSERHRTMKAVVAWSDELLGEPEREVFRDCSVFAGPVRADDLVGVLATPGIRNGAEAMALAADLVDRSLLVADTTTHPTRYRMLKTVRAHAGSHRSADVARRHATWFTEVAAGADAQLRTEREREGHERIEGVAAELRTAHAWGRDRDPALAARLTAALDLYAHSRLWGEPAAWAKELLARLPDDDPARPPVAAAVAADAVHRGDFPLARRLAEGALASTDPGSRASALETLADVALYSGSLDECRSLGDQLWALGREVGDLHAVAIGATEVAMTWAYGGDPDRALAILDGFEAAGELAPTDQAWLAYSRGEAQASDAPAEATALFERAIELGEAVGSRFVAGVARISFTSVLGRTGEPATALPAFARSVRDCRRNGNLTHGVTVLRNLIDFLVRIGSDEAAMTLLGALSDRSVKSTWGEEELRLREARQAVESRAGAAAVDRWFSEGVGRGLGWTFDYAMTTLATAG